MTTCDYCRASDSDENPIQRCGACKLVGYCSLECQKNDWKSHKKLCKLTPTLPPPSSTELVWRPHDWEIEDEDVPLERLDLNTTLDDAAKYMVNLRQVNISIPQEFMLQELNEMNGRSDRPVKLNADHFRCFIQNCSALEVFRIDFDDCCWKPVRRMTDNGRVFEVLGPVHGDTLKVLSLYMGVFEDVFSLANTIQALPNLRTLSLSYLTIGRRNNSSWEGSETPGVLATSISRHLHALVNLNLGNSFFSDRNLEELLSNGGTRLRKLCLAGMFGDHRREAADGVDAITDNGFAIIARCCPNIQELDLSEQRKATSSGVEVILRNCVHLRYLEVSGVQISASDLHLLLPLAADALLMFGFSQYGSGSVSADQVVIQRAVQATGGRILVKSDIIGLMEFPGISAAHKAAYDHSKNLVQEASDRADDPLCFNEWEFLFGVSS